MLYAGLSSRQAPRQAGARRSSVSRAPGHRRLVGSSSRPLRRGPRPCRVHPVAEECHEQAAAAAAAAAAQRRQQPQQQQQQATVDAARIAGLNRLFHLSPGGLAPPPSYAFADGGGGAGHADELWSRGLFLVSVDEKPPRTTGEKSPDYYANVGDAIRTLREDIPCLFQRELNYGIYRDDVTFRDPRNTFAGLDNYRLIFWSLRFHGRIFFKRLEVDVRRIWQPQDGLVCMRWTVKGIPRVPWEAEGRFDGISQYKLDSEGRIYEHAVDNVILRDPPMQGIGPLLAGLNLVPSAPQQPCPGAWLRGLEEGAAAAAATASAAWPAATALDSSSGWLGGTPMQLVPVTASGEQLGPVAAAGAASPDPA